MDLVWPLPAIQSEVDRYQKVVAEKEAELEAMRKHAGELVPVLDPEMERLMRARYGLPVEK